MKFIINFEKKHFWVLSALVVIIGIGVVIATAVNTAQPWHVLQQIAKSSTDSTSVDSDNNGVIDVADSVVGGGAGGPDADWTISGANMYSAVTGNVGIGIQSPTEKLEVDGSIKASGTICDGTGKCVGPSIGEDADNDGIIDRANNCDMADGLGGMSFEDLFPQYAGRDCTVVASADPPNRYNLGWGSIDVPNGINVVPDCLDNTCVIKLRKDDAGGSKLTQIRYNQRTSDNKWTTDSINYRNKNGDSSESNIVYIGGDNDRIILKDDLLSGDNRNALKWAVYWDNSDGISSQVIVCNT